MPVCMKHKHVTKQSSEKEEELSNKELGGNLSIILWLFIKAKGDFIGHVFILEITSLYLRLLIKKKERKK